MKGVFREIHVFMSLLVVFGFTTNENHCAFSWEVRECLYDYTMCKHSDLRTCEKVGELWSTGLNASLDFEAC